MKKRIIMLVVLCVASGLFIIGGRSKKSVNGVVFTNNTEESLRAEYEQNGKEISISVEPGGQFIVKKGFLRIHFPSYSGWFEMNLEADMSRTFNLTDIIGALTEEHLGDEDYLTRKGEIKGIKVFYEEMVNLTEPAY